MVEKIPVIKSMGAEALIEHQISVSQMAEAFDMIAIRSVVTRGERACIKLLRRLRLDLG